jgi:ATP-binding protein involved in chromosome partitioning
VASKEKVIQALSKVIDPDFKKDLVTLGMIKDVKVEGKKISFTVELTTPACPLKEMIRKDCEQTVLEELGNEYELDINMSSNVTTVRDQANTAGCKKYNSRCFR